MSQQETTTLETGTKPSPRLLLDITGPSKTTLLVLLNCAGTGVFCMLSLHTYQGPCHGGTTNPLT